MAMLQRWSLMEGSCYGGVQFNGGRIIVAEVAGLTVKLQRWSV